MKLKYDWKIAGHTAQIAELEKEILENRVSHAYLFSGPEQIGKFTLAKTMAGIIQCPNDYCHECAVCKEIEKGYHSDTLEMLDDGETIKIDPVRETLAKLNMSKVSPRKILMIQNLERITIDAANAMLKTLEDPPEGVMFIMTTSRVREILPTIISRVRSYDFHRLPDQKIVDLLQSLYPLVEPEILERTASYALGRPGRAVRFMREPELLEEARKMYNDIDAFVKKPDPVAEFAYVERIVKLVKDLESDKPLKDFLDTFSAILRAKMLEEPDGPARIKTVRLLDGVRKSRGLIKNHVNTRLLLENLMLQL